MRFTKAYENMGFDKMVAIPSNELERRFLQVLKYDLIDPDELLCDWHPERLGQELSLDYMKALGFTSVHYNGEDNRMTQEFEGEEYDIVATPSNLKVIIAGYRMLGKHRKVAKILKDVKRVDYYNN
jgi:hypothetical protein